MASLGCWMKPGLRHLVKFDGWIVRQGTERGHLQRHDELLGRGLYAICISIFSFQVHSRGFGIASRLRSPNTLSRGL